MYKQAFILNRLDLRKVYTHRRDAVIFTVRRTTREEYKKHIFYFGAIIRNNLPVNVHKIKTCDRFESFQKKHTLL